jgi:hypothetical protein
VIGDGARLKVGVGLNDTARRGLVNEVVGLEYHRYRESGVAHAERSQVLDRTIRGLLRERGPATVLRAQLKRQFFRLFDRREEQRRQTGCIAGRMPAPFVRWV